MPRQLTVIVLLLIWLVMCAQLVSSPRSDAESPTSSPFKSIISAHRGGRFIPHYPENSLATFELTHQLVPEAWIECDVSMTADSVLILLHDDSLGRTTTATGIVARTRWSVIDTSHLVDDYQQVTPYDIPTFTEALAWARNGVTLTVDVKRGVPYRPVLEAIQHSGLEKNMVIITYDLESACKVHAVNPDIRISVTIRNENELRDYLSSGIPTANLIAFTGTQPAPPALYRQLDAYGIPAILGTLGELDRQASLTNDSTYCRYPLQGIDIIATDRPVAVWRALRQCGD